jgi:hypothetical protein
MIALRQRALPAEVKVLDIESAETLHIAYIP